MTVRTGNEGGILITGLLVSVALASTPVLEFYGDSLSAGYLSGTSVVSPPPLSYISRVMSDTAVFKLTKNREKIMPHHRMDLAWPKFFAELEAKNAEIQNFALSGAKIHQLHIQLDNARPKSKAARAFFFIGHNDLCDWKNPPEPAGTLSRRFAKTLEKELDRWEARHENGTAYLVPVSDVPKIFEILKGYTWYDNGKVKFRCEESWDKFFPYCLPHRGRMLGGTLDRFLYDRIERMNVELREMALRRDAAGLKNRYRFLEDIDTKAMEPKHFAVDCYHLSEEGQRGLAQAIFTAVKAAD